MRLPPLRHALTTARAEIAFVIGEVRGTIGGNMTDTFDGFLHEEQDERPNHPQTCCCDRCKLYRRKQRFEKVSRGTYDPSLDPEPPPLASFVATEGVPEEVLPESGTLGV